MRKVKIEGVIKVIYLVMHREKGELVKLRLQFSRSIVDICILHQLHGRNKIEDY